MIFGELRELNQYKGINKNLDKAIDYILTEEYKKGVPGKNIVDGDTIYFNCPDKPVTKLAKDGFFEGHKAYIDIHIVISGEEKIGYVPRSKATIKKEYDEAGDYEIYEGEVETFLKLDDKKFVVFFPEEPHMAMIAANDKPEEIKKVIFKILVK